MCSICGMYGIGANLPTIENMNETMQCRGPDQNGYFVNQTVALGHNRLAVIDVQNGTQPMTIMHGENTYTIVYNGEIYNQAELNSEIQENNISLSTRSDTETVLWTYILFGEKCPQKLNGIFAFAIYDQANDKLFVCRDRLGVKPFYYTVKEGVFIFSSEIKALLSYPGIEAEIDHEGLWELLYLTPVTFLESGTFKNIKKLSPGEYAYIDKDGIKLKKYWELSAKEFIGSKNDALETVRELTVDAVKSQLISDVSLCTLLSGGLDSSIITSIAANEYKIRGGILSTYSFEYNQNNQFFKNSLFQPESDDLYASWLAKELGTNHTVLQLSSDRIFDLLSNAVDARDLPGQADIDSSLLGFCHLIKKKHTVALSGECSDEIFGGYPWFYRPEMLERDFFPWIHNPVARISLFDESISLPLQGYDFISQKYHAFCNSVTRIDSDDDQMYRSRIATQLSIYFFMQSLLERKDRMSMYSAVEVRVPFSDHRILEYVYNVPWNIKFENNVEKALLRNAMKGWLPDRVLFRKKSPYPKTHDPQYEKLAREAFLSIARDKNSYLHTMLDINKVNELINEENTTWFGQLMARPQLYAWMIQFEYWLNKYKVRLVP